MPDLMLLVEYIEGKWTSEEFCWILEDDEILCDYIRRVYSKDIGAEDYNIIPRIFTLNFLNRDDENLLIAIVERVLKHCGVNYSKAKKQTSELSLDDILLPYLKEDVMAEKYVMENILGNIPQGLKKSEKKAYCINHQKELYRFETAPPQWIQNGEWPYDYVTKKPMKFIKSYSKDENIVVFVFMDSQSKEFEVIQFF